jgi:predicted PurR-regulated permease PerM
MAEAPLSPTRLRHYASTNAMKLLAALALAYTFYFCRSLILPLLLAGLVALFASPVVRTLSNKFKVPRSLSAALVLVLLVMLVGYSISLLYEPAAQWLQRLPLLGTKLAEHVDGMADSFDALKENVLPGGSSKESLKNAMGSGLLPVLSIMAEATAMMLFQLAAIIMLTYFFLVFGDTLLRNMVRALPSLNEKKNLLSMFHTIRDDISRYVLVISIINILLGLTTALVFYLLDVPDPLLWGTLATILNYAPYLGPFLLTILLTGVGFIEYQQLSQILLLPGVFLLLNIIESQLITPLVLGKRFSMNPLMVVIWMFIWGWIWGAVGVLIAIPLLVCLKIIAGHLNIAPNWLILLDDKTVS